MSGAIRGTPHARTAKPIRILIVDDSPTSRALLVETFRSSGDFEVVGEATNGVEAIEQAVAISPDLIVMDVHMPLLDGVAATKEIMQQAPTPIVMVSASSAVNDVALGLSATQAGALVLVEKPSGPLSADHARDCSELLATAKAMAGVSVVRRWARRPGETPLRPETAAELKAGSAPAVRSSSPNNPGLITIGTSTGGPAALHRILLDIPRDFEVPIVVVQHMARGFIGGLAKWLGANVPAKVVVAEAGVPFEPGTVYIAPDGQHLGVGSQRRATLSDGSASGGFKPSADFLFDSFAREYGKALVAVVLTGMGQDGVAGLRTVAARGGWVIAQDEQSSIVFGMAQKAIENGLVSEVLPLELIGLRLIGMVVPGARVKSR